jgi:hypothetical protein
MMLVVMLAAAMVSCPEPPPGLMSLSLEAFDQSDSGWRSLVSPGCELRVADLIAEYRAAHADDPAVADDSGSLLWHEAQLRAAGGQTDAAIGLMTRSRSAAGEQVERLYIDATIAFLRRDGEALADARVEMAASPEPEWFTRAGRRWAETYPDLPPLVWPLNLDVVDRLIACFDRPYAEAYDCPPETN